MLRNISEIYGTQLGATDGTIRHVKDFSGFMMDHRSRAIADPVVETGHWYFGKEILISPAAAMGISFGDSEVSVKPTRAVLPRTREDKATKPAFSKH